MICMKDNIESLKNRISFLEYENRLLKERLDEAGVSYADIVTDIDEIMTESYDPNQGARIRRFEVTDKIASDFFMMFCRGRKDVYDLRYTNPNARGKAEAYEKALGFNKDNADELIEQIDDAVKNESVSPITFTETEYGMKYKYSIPVKGANGQIKNVIAVYQIDRGSQVPRMITNYVERKR